MIAARGGLRVDIPNRFPEGCEVSAGEPRIYPEPFTTTAA
jgi:hypothetical protein